MSVVELYNPANSAALKPEEIEGLQKLTSSEIRELAQAYPNSSSTQSYLLIVENNKPIEKQIPHLSTFESLYNLRERNALRQWVAYNFRGNYKPQRITPMKARKTEVLDLSDTDLISLPGFKTASSQIPAETAEVKKITKKKK